MRVYIATKNAGKVRELTAIFRDSPLEIAVYPAYREPAEGRVSYAANAALKAGALADQLAADGVSAVGVLADDSGIEVAALGGRPGVLSARYGGDGASWPKRRRRLLAETANASPGGSEARFVCALHLIAPDGSETAVNGEVSGSIAPEERGDLGFSYDAIFWYPPLEKTFAELSEEEKNRVSHRRVAARALLAKLGWADGDGS